ncbi:putative proline-rich antigen [Diaporthe ampelina]|uniref:Putative proline-rich antigen n=1 Tax=Diaporthe ampelina TaxID=1214573 RepID=A0A0G2FBN1_9PEZI|nr:putative proline-rich antigen [Diaporthe ampelina]
MQFKTLLSLSIAIVGAIAQADEDPLSQLPECAKSKLTDAFEATGCTSQTDTACWCPNADLKSSVENVTGGTTVCTDAADRKLIGNLWNEKCPDNTVTIA